MSAIAIIGVATLALVGLSVHGTINAGSKLKATVKKLRAKSLSGFILNLDLTLEVTNPTTSAITLNKVFLDALYEDSTIARIQEDSFNATLPAGKLTDVTLPLRINLTGASPTIWNVVRKVLSDGKLTKKAQVKGTIRVDGTTVDVDQMVPLTKK